MKLVKIGRNEEGQRVDRLVGKLIPRAEKGLVYKAIRKKIVTLNGKKTEPDVRVKEGDELRLFFSDDTLRDLGGTVEGADTVKNRDVGAPEAPHDDKSNLRINGYEFSENIIYEDSDVILVYKPAGILSQGAGERMQRTAYIDDPKGGISGSVGNKTGRSDEVSLNDLLIAYLRDSGKLSGTGETFRPSVCNRLDRNTSGIVVCGCSLKGLREMSELIHERRLGKYYLCAVKGILTEPGDLKGWLVKDGKINKVRVYKDKPDLPDALNIETKYSPLKSAHNMTLLEVELVTGRPHQIRAHMASIGHPVAGDPKYGDPFFNRLVSKEYGIKHQALTARRLVFPEDCRLEILKGKEFICKDPDWFEIF